jgi:T-complex protein 1 subunit theta
MALHFLERYRICCLKIGSKWDLRRFCSAVNATALVRLGPPTPDEMGACEEVTVREVGGKLITVFSQSPDSTSDFGTNRSCTPSCQLSTIILRASTSNVLADLERAVDDGVHAARMLCKDGRIVAGAGATELELAYRIRTFADSCPGLDQYAIRAFAKALEFVPKTLAENAGLDAPEIIARLNAAHANGHALAGVDIEGGRDGISGNLTGVDLETKVYDLLITKLNAFRLAIDAALTVLKVDQIIMSKPAGAKLKK